MTKILSGLLWLACGLVGTGTVPARAQTVSETVLYNFGVSLKGANPYAGVTSDGAGNLYGTTFAGGPANAGVVFKRDTAGHQIVLYSFTGGLDGRNPYAGVISDAEGNLYGTTFAGGPSDTGVVFKLDAAGHQTVLYGFTGGEDGRNPHAGVIRDSAGNLYGTTEFGGASGPGVVYKLDIAGNQTVLHNFNYTDGGYPQAGVIRDQAGNLYGTTQMGGTANQGTVFRLDTTGNLAVLYNFKGDTDGATPNAGVIRDAQGNLYGTATFGSGTEGLVYKLDTTGQETVLYNFTGGADGGRPYAGVVRDPAGNLYGTTFQGGTANAGVVYKLDPAGHQTVLYTFTGGADGGNPYAGVIRDSAGNLYGTTNTGGPGRVGALYKLDTAGHEKVLFTFPGASGGSSPFGGVISDSAGHLYGTTYTGGTSNAGVVYELDRVGRQTVLYTFTGGADGGNPYAGVVRDPAGNFYGTASSGGTAGAGIVYELDTAGHQTVLYNFKGGADGGNPTLGVTRDLAGNLYGTTLHGGSIFEQGVVFKLDAAGQYTVLHRFPGSSPSDGAYPSSALLLDSSGNLYGTASNGGTWGGGVVFKIDTAGQYTVLYAFTRGADGGGPSALIRDPAGNFYGTTFVGGSRISGVVFKLDTAGHQTVLYTFKGGADGGEPQGTLVRDAAGNLYGITYTGGTSNAGTVYKLDTTGHKTILYNFTGGADGGTPAAGVIADQAGHLYGTTLAGGNGTGGVVFKLN